MGNPMDWWLNASPEKIKEYVFQQFNEHNLGWFNNTKQPKNKRG